MAYDRIILFEEMKLDEAISQIKTLPTQTSNDNRHKFVFTENNELIIAKANFSNPSHRELGNTKRDKIAGYIWFQLEIKEITYVYLNNQSSDFDYPKFELLKEPQIFITELFGPLSIDMEDIPRPKSKIIDLSNLTTHLFCLF